MLFMEARSNKLLDPNDIPLKRKQTGNVWAKLVRLTRWLVVIAAFALLMVFFSPVFFKSKDLKAEKEKIKQKIAAEQQRNRQLTREFDLVKTNPEYVERIARDKLNLGKPDEMIFRFDAYPEAAPAPKR